MEITSMDKFLAFYEKTREGTSRILKVIPPDKMDWSYMPGKFTIADLIRHIAAIERNLFAKAVQGKAIQYTGCGKDLADGYDQVINYFNRMHEESVTIFKTISDPDLEKPIRSAGGTVTNVRSFLRALIIHESHHRGALCVYLSLFGIKAPPIYGFTSEDLVNKSPF